MNRKTTKGITKCISKEEKSEDITCIMDIEQANPWPKNVVSHLEHLSCIFRQKSRYFRHIKSKFNTGENSIRKLGGRQNKLKNLGEGCG